MTPAGAALIIGFVVILILAVMADKKGNKKFDSMMEEQYPVKDSCGNMFVTEKGELLYYLPSGTLKGYKKWNLSDIGYISSHISTYKKQFSICDRNMQAMKGEYLTPSKKPLKEKAYETFDIELGKNIQEYVDFLKKHAEHIQYAAGGKVVE